jgi:uncharacterized protein YkwD
LSDQLGMKTRSILGCLSALVSAAVLTIPGVSAAADSSVVVPDAAERLLQLINADRAQAGLQPLASRDDVASIAVSFSRRMAAEGNVWHNQDYLSSGTLTKLHATSVGENVSRTASVERTHVALMNSPHHRANILSPKFRVVGVGVVRDSANNIYVTQDFLTPADRTPVAAPARRSCRAACKSLRPARGRSVPRQRSLPASRPSKRRR